MNPHEDESRSLVVKVQYGDTLRRFVTSINGNLMDYNISKLRDNIIGLFELSPDADLILTYIDQDGDLITLDRDDELFDAAISQHLNPLRIYVKLKSDRNSERQSQAAKSTDPGLPQFQMLPKKISLAVEEAMKSLPEPFRGTLSKLSQDLVLKAAASSAFADMVTQFSEIRFAGQPSGGAFGQSSGTDNDASSNLVDLNVEPKTSSGPISTMTIQRSANSDSPAPEHTQGLTISPSTSQNSQGTDPKYVDLNRDPTTNQLTPDFPSINDLLSCTWYANRDSELPKESGDANSDKVSGKTKVTVSSSLSGEAIKHSSPTYVAPKQSILANPTKGVGEVSYGYNGKGFITSVAPAPYMQDSTLDVNLNWNLGVPTPEVPRQCLLGPTHPYRRTNSYYDSMLRTFHRGVRCDGCGMHPIMGPRFKSKVKDNYDLCSFCFSEVGNEAHYKKIERAPYSPRQFRELPTNGSRNWLPLHPPPGVFQRPLREKKEKFESRFIQDITVLDGTVMPPCTPFTKIWRMRNNGPIAWPRGTQLVWTGGENFGHRGLVVLEISANGCPVHEDFDIAVDFASPLRPGSYISYWRMASPSGQKFGQSVWVQIMVENPRPIPASSSHGDLNLNLPPESNGGNGLAVVDMNVEPLNVGGSKPSGTFGDSVTSMNVEPETMNGLLDTNDGLTQTMPRAGPSVFTPIFSFPSSSSNASPIVDVPQSGAAAVHDLVEQKLLDELEEMGFKQIDLNKEVLRQNEYDLEQSLDTLCGYAEWDPLLVELKEMGFEDKELNKKLLVKNGGSIKRTVLDLVGVKVD